MCQFSRRRSYPVHEAGHEVTKGRLRGEHGGRHVLIARGFGRLLSGFRPIAPTPSDEPQLGRSHATRAVLVGAAGSAHGRSCIAKSSASARRATSFRTSPFFASYLKEISARAGWSWFSAPLYHRVSANRALRSSAMSSFELL